MANSEMVMPYSALAGEDLRGDIYKFMSMASATSDGENAIERVVKTTGPLVEVSGILWQGIPARDPDPSASTNVRPRPIPVAPMVEGTKLKVEVGAAVTRGQYVVPSSTAGLAGGVGALSATNRIAYGQYLEDGAANDVVSFRCKIRGALAPTLRYVTAPPSDRLTGDIIIFTTTHTFAAGEAKQRTGNTDVTGVTAGDTFRWDGVAWRRQIDA